MKKKEDKRTKIWKFIFLFVPLLVAALLLIYIKTSQKVEAGSEFMAPLENTTIITSLVAFMAGYLCFLILMFFDDIKLLFLKHKTVK